MRTFIIVKNEFEGVHRYENAPDEVSYLRNNHRHIFIIKSKIEVFHEDRELEFIMVKHTIRNYLRSRLDNNGCYYLGNDSCEQIATNIYNLLKQKYGTERCISVEVSEDNENSALIEEEN